MAPTKKDKDRALAYFMDARAFCRRLAVSEGNLADHDETMPERIDPSKLTPSSFLREYAWVVYVSGFKVREIEARWAALKSAWRGFSPAKIDDAATTEALQVFNHPKKVGAIARTAELLRGMSFAEFKRTYLSDVESVATLPFMGPIIRFHLTRNLGVDWDVAKPDLWLVKAARVFGFGESPAGAQRLCELLAEPSGLRVGVVDLILWRYLRLDTLDVQLRILGRLSWLFERSDELLSKLQMASSVDAELSELAYVDHGWLQVGSLWFEGHRGWTGDSLRDDLAPVALAWRWTPDEPIRPCIWGNMPKVTPKKGIRRTFADASVDVTAGEWQYDLRCDRSVWDTNDPNWLLDDWGDRVAALAAPNARAMGEQLPTFYPDDDPHNRDWLRIMAAKRRAEEQPK